MVQAVKYISHILAVILFAMGRLICALIIGNGKWICSASVGKSSEGQVRQKPVKSHIRPYPQENKK